MELEVTWGRAAKVWLSMFLAMLIFCLFTGIALGVVLGTARFINTRLIGANPMYLNVTELIFYFVIGVAGQVYGMKKVLQKKYSNFRVSVIGAE